MQAALSCSLMPHLNYHTYAQVQQRPKRKSHSVSSHTVHPRIPCASKNTSCTCVSLLLAKRVHPRRCNKYARAATIQWHTSIFIWYTSCSHDSWTYEPWHWIISALASAALTLSNSTNILMASSTWSCSKLWNAPMIGTCSNNAMSSKVIAISPMGKWKLLVSLCQCSTKANISPQSPVSREHAIKGLSPLAATRPSISRAGLPNLAICLPWEDSFSWGRSYKQ